MNLNVTNDWATATFSAGACPVCGHNSLVTVRHEGRKAMLAGTPVQDAFPELTPAQREFLKSGLHPDCGQTLGLPG